METTIEDGGRSAEPDVRLRIDALESQAIQDLLRSHVQPAHIDIRAAPFEVALEQLQLIAPVGRVEYDRSSGVTRTGGCGT